MTSTPPTKKSQSKESDLTKLKDTLWKGDLLTESQAKLLCNKAKEIFSDEPNILTIQAPITICGDIHGQFYDLKELFKCGGSIEDNEANYLFLGDYVDRGYNSIEVFLLLIWYKIHYPSRVFLLRGNHESRQVTQVYGCYDECIKKYGSADVWKCMTEVFDQLPICAIVQNSVFCVHGGLSPSLTTLDQISALDRKHEVPKEGPMTDLLWSDPDSVDGFKKSARGAGYLFGADAVKGFLVSNKLDLVCRAHQLQFDGFRWMFEETLVTVWSAPNYCYRCGNMASIMEIDENMKKNFQLFDCAPNQIDERSCGDDDDTRILPDYFL